MATPVSDDIDAVGNEDGMIIVTLTAYDPDDGDSIAPIFRLNDLPANGSLADSWAISSPPAPIMPPTLLIRAPASGCSRFISHPIRTGAAQSISTISPSTATGTRSTPSTGTVTADAIADAPLIDANVNDQPDPLWAAVNVTLTAGAENDPVVTALDGGRTLVVWQQGLLPASISARIYGADGVPEGPAFAITASGGSNEVEPAVAARADGSFAVTWIADGTGTGGGDVYTAFYAPGGTTPIVTVNTNGHTMGREVRSDRDGSRRRVRRHLGQAVHGCGRYLRAALHDRRHRRWQPFLVVSQSDPVSPFVAPEEFQAREYQVVAVGDDGAFVITNQHYETVIATLVDADNNVGASVATRGLGGRHPSWPSWPAVVLSWCGTRTASPACAPCSSISTGAAVTPDLMLVDMPSASEFTPEIATLPDGRFVVAWVGNGGSNGTNDIFAQVFAADGTPAAGGPLNISNTGFNGSAQSVDGSQPTITVHEDGTFTVGWLRDPRDRRHQPRCVHPQLRSEPRAGRCARRRDLRAADDHRARRQRRIGAAEPGHDRPAPRGIRAVGRAPRRQRRSYQHLGDRSHRSGRCRLSRCAGRRYRAPDDHHANRFQRLLQLEIQAQSIEISDPSATELSGTTLVPVDIHPAVEAVDDSLAAVEDTPVDFTAADILGNRRRLLRQRRW